MVITRFCSTGKMTSFKRHFLIGISSVSGGGKTAVANRLAELLPDSVTLCFDDYDDTTVHPDDLQKWLAEGADYNVWQTPVLTSDLEALTTGRYISSSARYVIFDAPLGRAHSDTGRFIDFMGFIDTPLDVAMARRLLRDMASHGEQDAESNLKSSLSSYLDGVRLLYLELQNQVKRTCDLVLDGCLSVDELAMAIHDRVRQQHPD